MHDFVQTRDILNDLASLGVTIALDDFGTGYSSLSYLRQFPLNVLKIDRSFVIDMDKEQQAHDIVTAIVHLALSLELTIVAEGIENFITLSFKPYLLGSKLADFSIQIWM